jgi:uncharacterized protein YkwD
VILGIWWLLADAEPPTSAVTDQASVISASPAVSTTPAATVSPTIAPSPATTDSPLPAIPTDPDRTLLGEVVLTRLNRERRLNGLEALVRDGEAERAGQKHAEEMVEFAYANSWNLDGLQPAYRYSLEGGTGSVTEYPSLHQDLFVYRPPDTTIAEGSIPNLWQAEMNRLLDTLLEDPDYQALVQDPTFSHIGIGIGYDIVSGRLALAQEFVRKYVPLQTLIELQYTIGETITLQGKLDSGTDNPTLELAYAPLPTSREIEQLRQEPFVSPAEVYQSGIPISVASDNQFQVPVPLDYQGQPGLYTMRILVEVALPEHGGEQQLAGAEIVVRVEGDS